MIGLSRMSKHKQYSEKLKHSCMENKLWSVVTLRVEIHTDVY